MNIYGKPLHDILFGSELENTTDNFVSDMMNISLMVGKELLVVWMSHVLKYYHNQGPVSNPETAGDQAFGVCT